MDIRHLQNDLEEFFAMVNFTNPGILGSIAHFRRYYEVITFYIFDAHCCKIYSLSYVKNSEYTNN